MIDSRGWCVCVCAWERGGGRSMGERASEIHQPVERMKAQLYSNSERPTANIHGFSTVQHRFRRSGGLLGGVGGSGGALVDCGVYFGTTLSNYCIGAKCLLLTTWLPEHPERLN